VAARTVIEASIGRLPSFVSPSSWRCAPADDPGPTTLWCERTPAF
jgi:hypothetical protein